VCAFFACAVLACRHAPEKHQLLIQRIGPSASAIHLAHSDGSDERPLLANSALDYNASLSADNKWVAFTSERQGSADIYRVRLDGSSLERLTDDPAYDDQASWSPDGNQIAFVSTRGSGSTDIWILDVASRTARPLAAHSGGDFRPSWSPDGQWIAFSSDRDTKIERDPPAWEHLHRASIYVIRPNGTQLRRVTNGDTFAGSPRWSADSKRVVFYEMTVDDTYDARDDARQAKVVSQIISIDVQNGVRREHTSGPGLKVSPQFLEEDRIGYVVKAGPAPGIFDTSGKHGPAGGVRNPSWSQDGQLVIYDRGRSIPERRSYDDLHAFFSRNTEVELVQLGRLATSSADGCRLAFSEPVHADWAIAVMDANGTARRRVFEERGAAAMAPHWSRDGRRIVFGLGPGFETRHLPARIMMIEADGSNLRTLTMGPGAGFPSLSPDGQHLVFRVWGTERGLRILSLGDGAVTRLTSDYDTFPGWSPTHDLIAFTRWHDDDFDIYTIRPDGTGLKRLTITAGNDAHSTWSPDGQYLMFASSRYGFKDEAPLFDDQPQPYGELFMMRADGTEQRPLTDNQWEDGPGTWRPEQNACR
jgi:TolB protein